MVEDGCKLTKIKALIRQHWLAMGVIQPKNVRKMA
jgi:hypothetical protein